MLFYEKTSRIVLSGSFVGGEMKEEYSRNQRRWYDKDPVLSRSMKTLEESDDESQIKVALNLIKIIIEHQITSDDFTEVGDIIAAVEEGQNSKNSSARWYDIDKTVRTAIAMLEGCPSATQAIIAKEMAKFVIQKIKEDEILEDSEEEEFVV